MEYNAKGIYTKKDADYKFRIDCLVGSSVVIPLFICRSRDVSSDW